MTLGERLSQWLLSVQAANTRFNCYWPSKFHYNVTISVCLSFTLCLWVFIFDFWYYTFLNFVL